MMPSSQVSSSVVEESPRADEKFWRRLATIAGAVLVIVESLLAARQLPRPEPLRTLTPMSFDWWRYPIERNAVQRLPVTKGPILAVYARPGTSHVWFAGAGGLVTHSTDDGRSWHSINLRAEPASAPDTITRRRPPASAKKASWQRSPRDRMPASLVSFTSSATWQQPAQQQQAQQPVQRSKATPTPKRNPSRTARRDTTRAAQTTATPPRVPVTTPAFYPRFTQICFTGAGAGLVVGESGAVFRSADDGATWTQASSTRSSGAAPSCPDTAVINVDTAVVTRHDSGVRVRLAAASPTVVYAAAGSALRTTDRGRSWHPLIGTMRFHSLAFSDSLNGVAGMENGVVARTSNGGRHWTIEPAATPAPPIRSDSGGVRSVNRISPALSYGLDSLGNLLQSTDRERTWSAVPLDAPRKYPAPWYYGLVVLTVGGALAVPRLRRTREKEHEQSIADVLVSDRPLREGDRDVLDFGTIAAGLSRFIRNTRTEPPLTIAITGRWGTGKSSLMNLLRRDLERRGFRTIWFNAWHHQREESLLASLLESIRLTATPPVWTPKGFRFRRRLLARRIARYRAPALMLLPVFAFAVGYILKDPARRWHELDAAFSSVVRVFSSGAKADSLAKVDSIAKLSSPHLPSEDAAGKTLLALAISIAGTVLTYLRGLKAFGVKPEALARSMVAAGSVRTIAAPPAFRYRFAQDFNEVTEALKPERIVVFIDDLDRCKPEQVLEILEAINFLADSGDCVVVLGIDRQRVTGCVAIGFKEVATVLAETRLEPSSAATAPPPPGVTGVIARKSDIEYQLEYARNYLEKMLNMEVPIPPVTAEELGEVMACAGPEPERAADEATTDVDMERRERDRRRMRGRLFVAGVAALAVVFFYVGLNGAFWRRNVATFEPVQAGVAGVGVRPGGSATIPIDTAALIASGEHLLSPLPLIEGVAPDTVWWLTLLCVLAAIGGVVWLITPREDNRIEDSAAFATALRAWAPVLFMEHPTPRSAKKFLNRMRFLSMAQRAPAPRRSPAEAILARLSGLPWLRGVLTAFAPREQTQEILLPGSIPEATLVSLNVIREQRPEWLRDVSFWNLGLREYVSHRNPVPLDIVKSVENLPPDEAQQGLQQYREAWNRLEVWVRDN